MKKETKIKLIYAGKRFDNGKISQVFLTEDGKEFFYSGVHRVYIGCFYEATKQGDRTLISSRPVELGESNHADEMKWRALSRGAEEQRKNELVKKKADSLKTLLNDVGTIKKFVKGMRFSEKRAFVDWLMNEIEREETERTTRAFNIRIQNLLKRTGKNGKTR
jgi:hypothetical protein